MLPIPPGVRWSDAMPVMVAKEQEKPPRAKRAAVAPPVVKRTRQAVRFGPPGMYPVTPAPVVVAAAAVVEKVKRPPIDPAMVAAARELRDRYLEHYNAQPTAAGAAKYEVGRLVSAKREVVGLLAAA